MIIEQLEPKPAPKPFKPVRITLHSQSEVNAISLLVGRVAGSGKAANFLKELFEELREFDNLSGTDRGSALGDCNNAVLLGLSADKALGFTK